MKDVEIKRVDWEILDALSDDYESVEQIQKLIRPTTLSQEEIIQRLEQLHSENYVFLILNRTFDRAALIREIGETKDRKYWFGRTEKGYLAWQRLTQGFCDNPQKQV